MGGCWKDQLCSPSWGGAPLAGGGEAPCLPVWGLGRVMWSWGLGCMRTNGSSTETSLEGGNSMKGQHSHAPGRPPHPPQFPHHTHPPRDTTSFTLTL